MINIPDYINWVFYFSVVLTLVFLLLASPKLDKLAAICIGWISIQMVVSSSGYYLEPNQFPPPLAFLVVPPFLVLLVAVFAGFNIKNLRSYKAGWLTFLHLVRIPVELVLFWLYKEGMVPKDMTFEGRNFDIFMGLTAPIVAYLGYVRPVLPIWFIITWNLVGLGFLINIIGLGILSAPGPFHIINLDQPNVAVLNFPFAWLPSFIVPSVMFAHLASIRKIFIK